MKYLQYLQSWTGLLTQEPLTPHIAFFSGSVLPHAGHLPLSEQALKTKPASCRGMERVGVCVWVVVCVCGGGVGGGWERATSPSRG